MKKEVGLVEYSIDSRNTMAAEWFLQMNGQYQLGTGFVKGKNNGEFEGDYLVTYFDDQHEQLAEFDLSIQKVQNGFALVWKYNNEVKFTGVGQIRNGKLVAAYTNHA